MAQILFKPADSVTSLSIHGNTINCENVEEDVDEVIFKYDIDLVIGRPSVFRLGESLNNVIMEQITTETERNEDVEQGLRDPALFTM